MPGGEQAIREPWRMALAHLHDAGEDDHPLRDRIPAATLAVARRLIERQFHAPRTSSAGRLFDGVATLAGVRDRVSHEGQAAMELEWLASEVAPTGIIPSRSRRERPMAR
jgi:hydrogenase maturation protein HypF